MRYIQRKDGNDLETVDQCETIREARYLVNEYRICDPSALYYISNRCCKHWRDRK